MPATDAPAPEQVAREGLRVALGLHQQGRLADAERLYDALLGHDPRDANAMHFLGVLKHQRGHVDDALALIRASIGIDAQVAAWHNNLGNVLLSSGEPEQAARAYARCSELDPGNVQVLNNLGVLLRQTGRSEEAEARFKQAVQRDPSFVDAHSNLATLYSLRGDVELAFAAFARALELRPGHAQSRRVLGAVYAQLGRLDDAARVYREWLEHEPGSVQARHHLAAVGGEPAPERASDDYVTEVFDAFADSFDQRLGALEYRAPALIASALRQRLGDPPALLDVLDAGCGTGLCANGLLPYARRLVGVDLSASMLSRAAARDEYDELVHAELTAFIAGRPAAFDLIVSGDTLCYFGRLDEVLPAAHAALRAGGWLVFTVESHDDEADFRLQPHGRYSHARRYVADALAAAGFGELALDPVALRNEGGHPVQGWLAAARAREQ